MDFTLRTKSWSSRQQRHDTLFRGGGGRGGLERWSENCHQWQVKEKKRKEEESAPPSEPLIGEVERRHRQGQRWSASWLGNSAKTNSSSSFWMVAWICDRLRGAWRPTSWCVLIPQLSSFDERVWTRARAAICPTDRWASTACRHLHLTLVSTGPTDRLETFRQHFCCSVQVFTSTMRLFDSPLTAPDSQAWQTASFSSSSSSSSSVATFKCCCWWSKNGNFRFKEKQNWRVFKHRCNQDVARQPSM